MAALGDFERFTVTDGVQVCHGTVEVPDRWINDDPAINSNRGRIIIRILRAAGPDEDFDEDTEDTVHDIIIDDRQDPHLVLTATIPEPQQEQEAVREPLSDVYGMNIAIAVEGVTRPNAWYLADFDAPFWAWTLKLSNERNGEEVTILADFEMLSGDAIDIELVRVE
ncbi:hypothetical protein LTR10_010014 [Elasticomyces elasticus]|nr:hypothetical protein LTR10_010014 [Elasticomyces elasticus]KAK4970306.1 hypothetical protein LTR42_008473 [Elasticomyces elasticus]